MPARFPESQRNKRGATFSLGRAPARQDLLPGSPRSRLFRKPTSPHPAPAEDTQPGAGWGWEAAAVRPPWDTRAQTARCAGSGSPGAQRACGWEGPGAPGHAPASSHARLRRELASPGAAGYISHPARAGRTGAASLRPWVLLALGREGGRRGPTRPLCCAPPVATAGAPPPAKSGSRFTVPAGQERKGREKFRPVGARSSLRSLSGDGGPDSLGRAPDDAGQDLLSWRGGLCGGCDHLPAGHGQSSAPGGERDEDGEVSQGGEGTPILCALLITALV